jgi:hypothetical protein
VFTVNRFKKKFGSIKRFSLKLSVSRGRYVRVKVEISGIVIFLIAFIFIHRFT